MGDDDISEKWQVCCFVCFVCFLIQTVKLREQQMRDIDEAQTACKECQHQKRVINEEINENQSEIEQLTNSLEYEHQQINDAKNQVSRVQNEFTKKKQMSLQRLNEVSFVYVICHLSSVICYLYTCILYDCMSVCLSVCLYVFLGWRKSKNRRDVEQRIER